MIKRAKSFWGTSNRFAAMGLIAAINFYLFIEHRQHLFDSLPYFLLLPGLILHRIMHLRGIRNFFPNHSSNFEGDQYEHYRRYWKGLCVQS